MIKKICTLFLIGSMTVGAWAQKTPGGVSGAKLWLRADTLVTGATDGATITGWGDVTGNNTQTFGGSPKFVANSNGFKAIQFASCNVQTSQSNPYKTLFWIGILNMPNNSDYKRVWSWNTGVAPVGTERSVYMNTVCNIYLHTGKATGNPSPLAIASYPDLLNPSPTNAYFRFGHMEGKRQDSPRSRMYIDMPTCMGFYYTDDDSDMYSTVNGTSVLWTRPHPSGHQWASANGKIVLGGYYAATKTSITNSFTGQVYEFIGFDRQLTPIETKKVESYIAMKYGINMVASKPFTARITNSESANSIGRDYLLSDGTIIWPGESEKGLDHYEAYFNFLVRDDLSDLHLFKHKPSYTLQQWKSSYLTSVMYFDNNVTVANGGKFDAPKRLANKNYFVMAGSAYYGQDSMVSATPYTSTTRTFNGKTYQCWDREYKMKVKGIDTVSIQVDPLNYIENLPQNGSMRFGCTDWASKYGSNPGILVVSGTQSTFVPGVLESGVLKVNAIPVKNNALLYVVFASVSGELKINEGSVDLCAGASAYQFTASLAGGTWSDNAPNGLFSPTTPGKETITYTLNGIKTSVEVGVVGSATAAVLLDRTNLYNGQKAYAEVTTTNAGLHPNFSFGLNGSNYSALSLVPVFTFDASQVSAGSNTLNVRIVPSGGCAEFSASANFTRADQVKQQPAGVEGSAIWIRGDKVKTFDGSYVSELTNLGESDMRIFARVNADTVPAVQNTNWMNGQAAINFGGKSFYETDQIKNWKSFFIVHDFRGRSMTALTMRYDNPTNDPALVQGANECYFFNLAGNSGYGWQLGFQKEQRVNLFANNWGVPDNSMGKLNATTGLYDGTFVDASLQYLKERGLGLPIMSSFVKRGDNRYVQSVNGTAALEYTRASGDANMVTLDMPGRLFLGAAYKPSYLDSKGAVVPGYPALFGKHLNGDIAEFIGFDRYLSAYEINKIESYLAMRYGFSIRGYNADEGCASNSDYRDYILSDGTLVYPIASDPSLQNYWEQVNFLVRDDATMLHNKFSAPISHGQQYGVSEINPANAGVYAFNRVTDQTRGGRVVPAGNLQLTVGTNFASPQDIATDKAFVAMGVKYYAGVNDYAYFCTDSIIFKTPAKAAYKVRANGIDKVSAKIGALSATPFESGFGIIQVKDNNYTFNAGTLESGSLIVNGFTPVNDAELMVVLATATNPISFGTLADARKGEVYYGAVTASASGSTSFTYQLMLGNLPDGLSMNEYGVISGSPISAGGSSTFTVRATDQRGIYKDQQFTMNVLSDINCAPVAQPRKVIQGGQVGERSVASIRVPEISGYSILGLSAGNLPAGMELQENGMLQGIPEVEGNSKFVVRVKDAQGCEGDVVFDVDIVKASKLHPSLVNVFPNPASGSTTITINAELPELLRVQVISTNNQLVKAQTYGAGTKQIRLDLTGLKTGQYFILLTSEGKKVSMPIVVK